MQHASLYAVAFVTVGTLIAACASSDPPDDGAVTPTQEQPATEPAPKGTGNGQAPPAPPPPPECETVKCTADSDCATACGTASSKGCCDTATHQCFKSSAAECPQPPSGDDGGTPTSY